MEHSVHSLLDRLSPDRRRAERRARRAESLLASQEVFGPEEQQLFRRLERRVGLRRRSDMTSRRD